MIEVLWILLAFVFGLGVRMVGLPPLVGFLIAGFVLNAFGVEGGDVIDAVADFGVQLLLFSIGLKLDLKSLVKPSVWGVASIHMAATVALFGGLVFVVASSGLELFTGLSLTHCLILGFALSFSSTVFAVKVLEESGQMSSQYGRLAIGILIVQDIFAIVFMTLSAGKVPSIWALLLLALPLARPLLLRIMSLCGHGELLVLLGILLALGGAELFSLVNLKADLGPLVFGVLVGSHPKANEMAKHLFGFKEVFLTGFFHSIGLGAAPTWTAAGVAAVLVVLLPLKVAGFFLLMTRFRVRIRAAFFATVSLSNYSEFGLIVCAVGVKAGWLPGEWLVVIALALSFSLVAASVLNSRAPVLYEKRAPGLNRFESRKRLSEDEPIDLGQPDAIVIGMGSVGTATYDQLNDGLEGAIVGIDSDAAIVEQQIQNGRKVFHGDPLDLGFLERICRGHPQKLLLVTFRNFETQIQLIRMLRHYGYEGRLVVLSQYPDQCAKLKEAGADAAFDYASEVGIGLAEHALRM